jgi:hypothetical protein
MKPIGAEKQRQKQRSKRCWGGGRTIKKPNRKGRKGNKKLKHKKGE